MNLVGIHGLARSGKDTLAEFLAESFGFQAMAFAVPLKFGVANMFGWPPELCFSQEGKEFHSEFWGVLVRKALQDVGEMMCEEYGDDFWVRRWELEYLPVRDSLDVVVTDVRKEVEAMRIRELGGVVVHIRRAGAGLTGDLAKHVTERGIQFDPDHDYLIDNNGTLADLQVRARHLVEFLRVDPNLAGSRN